MVTTPNDKIYEFYINNEDMENGKPKFKTHNGRPLENGCLAINVNTKKGFLWDAEKQEWN